MCCGGPAAELQRCKYDLSNQEARNILHMVAKVWTDCMFYCRLSSRYPKVVTAMNIFLDARVFLP